MLSSIYHVVKLLLQQPFSKFSAVFAPSPFFNSHPICVLCHTPSSLCVFYYPIEQKLIEYLTSAFDGFSGLVMKCFVAIVTYVVQSRFHTIDLNFNCGVRVVYTVEPRYYEHQGDRNKCPCYRGVRFREVGFIWILVCQGTSELSVIDRCL